MDSYSGFKIDGHGNGFFPSVTQDNGDGDGHGYLPNIGWGFYVLKGEEITIYR